jgi:hypothetical protein
MVKLIGLGCCVGRVYVVIVAEAGVVWLLFGMYGDGILFRALAFTVGKYSIKSPMYLINIFTNDQHSTDNGKYIASVTHLAALLRMLSTQHLRLEKPKILYGYRSHIGF